MAKKALKKKSLAKKTLKKSKSTVNKLTDPVVDSAREIWLAGLGAFAVAQSEGSKVVEQGSKLFETLVAEGAKLEKNSRKMAESGAARVKGKVTGVRDDVEDSVEATRKQAQDKWNKLEDVFEDRVTRVMGRLGVPSSDDLQKLTKRVEALSKQVAELNKRPAAKPAAAKKPAPIAEVTVFHLVPKDSDWAVTREGEDADLSVHNTKKTALDAARGIAQAVEPSRLVVHRADGTIQTSYSYGEEA